MGFFESAASAYRYFRDGGPSGHLHVSADNGGLRISHDAKAPNGFGKMLGYAATPLPLLPFRLLPTAAVEKGAGFAQYAFNGGPIGHLHAKGTPNGIEISHNGDKANALGRLYGFSLSPGLGLAQMLLPNSRDKQKKLIEALGQ